MSHFFCHSCGNKISYGHAKPNFCPKCGQQLNASVSSNVGGNTRAIEESVVISENETDAQSVPQITSFQVEIESEDKSVTLGSLLGEQSSPDYEKRRRTLSVDEFIDEKKKEG